ncbi:GAF domain-containing protein [Deinococcus sp. RIT780]|uniref:GAF domain-containing sensor histidine kinase n=1 Tax=Deinococcus sp. RIT780 TaxID=2870472 RepID=UPI001C8AA4F5|nr:GAF domain-containing protein [Deinococcus sp. RIT780]MBX8463645.1 GAF domain-containing protein [Deinococcus sp. RIT780]
MTRLDPLPLPPALVSLLLASEDVMFVLNGDGEFEYLNGAAAALLHLEAHEALGRPLERDFPHLLSEQWYTESRHVRATGRAGAYDAFSPAVGGWVRVSLTPHGDSLAVHLRDVSSMKRKAALQQITADLVRASSVPAVLTAALTGAVPVTAATGGVALRLTPGGDALTCATPPCADSPVRLPAGQVPDPLPLGQDHPACEAVRAGQAIFAPDGPHGRVAALPLNVDGRPWGALLLTFGAARPFPPAERQFLLTLTQQCTQALTQLEARRHLEEQAENLTTLNRVGQTLAAELDLRKLVQGVTDAGVTLTGAQFGAFFYNLTDRDPDGYRLHVLSGAPHEAFAEFPTPRMTGVFGPTFAGRGVVRAGDITRDGRYGQLGGMPPGHLPVRSYLAVPVTSRSGEVLGALLFGHPDPDVFTDRSEQLAVGLASQTAAALDNARLYQQLQDSHALLETRVDARTRELAEQTVALEAFARFTEAAGTSTDVRTLARQALTVFRRFFAQCSAAYYERSGDHWYAQVWTEDIAPHVVQSITAGVPADAPAFLEAARTHAPVFVDGWEAGEQQVAATEDYGTVALYPMLVAGEIVGMLAVGLLDTRVWTERDRAVVRAAGRSMNLSLERAEVASQLQTQRDTLQARTQALEAFAELTRDLTLEADPHALIRRAQEIILSLLPDGYALYWEREGEHLHVRTQVGQVGSDDLQRQLDAGLPYRTTLTVRRPFESGEPLYQDEYDRGHDGLQGIVEHISTTASLPVQVDGTVQGVIVVGLFGQRRWNDTDRALLDTVTRSLSLTLEGAQKARALQERTQELERSNGELERFAFAASHDLQEPLRTITSFTELIDRRYGPHLDPQGQRYLGIVTQGARRMKGLIDDLLVFSRLNAVREPLQPLNLSGPLQDALSQLQAAVEGAGAQVTWDALPDVMGIPGELTQLLQNLIGNAVKFRRPDAAPRVHVSATRRGEQWEVRVQDNGIGFEAQYAERVFQLFQRLHLRDQYEGTGMGLAIVRKITEHHGGRIWAESTPGQGSAFTFTLPAQPA